MYFMILGNDKPENSYKRAELRASHLQRLQELNTAGRLLLAGPFPQNTTPPSFDGSLIVAEFDSLEAAKAWIEQDAYYLNDVYENVTIKPFIKGLP